MNNQLDLSWKVWYHSINNNSWANDSYKHIFSIENVFDIKVMIDYLKQNYLQNGMFFIKKGDIFPTWESPENREGCSISFKLPASNLKESWDLFLKKIITGEIVKESDKFSEINGFSISPKKEFNIVKLWLKTNDLEFINSMNEYPPYFVSEKSIHRKHLS